MYTRMSCIGGGGLCRVIYFLWRCGGGGGGAQASATAERVGPYLRSRCAVQCSAVPAVRVSARRVRVMILFLCYLLYCMALWELVVVGESECTRG